MSKHLVPVANKPVLVHGLEGLRDAGVTDVAIIVGDHGDEIRQTVAAHDLGLAVTYVHQSAPLGLAHCVAMARRFLGDDDFVMLLGDNIVVGGIAPLAEAFDRHRPAAALYTVQSAQSRGVRRGRGRRDGLHRGPGRQARAAA